jgi:N-hydroxyarylamine O-acetyltransferase
VVTEDGTIDLDAYFARISYQDCRLPTISNLHGIAAAHVAAIPFENIDILLGQPIRLDAGSLQKKLVMDHHGGYCFEHNGLMFLVLSALGFTVNPIAARVRTQLSRDVVPPRTHLFLRVDIDNSDWLVDVGIGGLSLTSAIRLEIGLEQPTPHETRRLVFEDDRYFHQARLGEAWSDVCEFTLETCHPIDWEVANWWTSTSPSSKFRNRLMVARAGATGERLTINNKQFTVRNADGQGQTEVIRSHAHLLSILENYFSLKYPSGTYIQIPGEPW